ncbi:hypothetical protein Q7C36_015328 [Tachysurus vachellii]|uniref:Uncharacterized protein n=1 Tax=Tachysurus vachellii TaxID=175792 RepID=A0AA88SCT7_TACVA|nr:hypothetical protein Q7C36_015328 [Tachysurus vachellii]
METFMSAVWAAVQSFSLGPLLVSVVAATAAVVIYYYVNRDDEEETTENTEDTTGSNSNISADQNTPQSPAGLVTHQMTLRPKTGMSFTKRNISNRRHSKNE